MAEHRTVRVGSRKSELALIQTSAVIEKLKGQHPDIKFETITMNTTGDRLLDSALFKIGEKSLFTRELEEALLTKKVDFVVHSLKDLPTEIPAGLVIGAVLKRDNPEDAVVMHPRHQGKKLSDLPPGSVIGTSALRRAAQLRRNYPHLTIENIRGNLSTRFRKLYEDGSTYAAIILAVSGLERMKWKHLISQVLSADDCMYAVCQGALAVECRGTDQQTLQLLCQLNHLDTALTCVAERAFLRTLEGGCSVPVSVFCERQQDQLLLRGGVFSISGTEVVQQEMTCGLLTASSLQESGSSEKDSYISIVCHQPHHHHHYHNARQLGADLASSMIQAGAGAILTAAKQQTKHDILAQHAKRKQMAEAVGDTRSEATPAKLHRQTEHRETELS